MARHSMWHACHRAVIIALTHHTCYWLVQHVTQMQTATSKLGGAAQSIRELVNWFHFICCSASLSASPLLRKASQGVKVLTAASPLNHFCSEANCISFDTEQLYIYIQGCIRRNFCNALAPISLHMWVSYVYIYIDEHMHTGWFHRCAESHDC